MNKQLSVMGLAARASMVPVLIASGLTALAVGVLTYLANPENTGGAAGVGAAPLAAAVGYLMVMVMLCLGGCGFGSQTAYTVRRLRLCPWSGRGTGRRRPIGWCWRRWAKASR